MALGGGTWLTQNKVLPGSYIVFSSVPRASATLSDRGYAAAPFELSWGPEGTVFPVTSGEFQKNSKTIFGYAYDHPKMLPLREIFTHATTVYCYRLGTGAVKANNTLATAKYGGVRGNDITIVVAANVDEEELWDVTTYVDGVAADTQTVADAEALVSNDWVDFKTDATLEASAGMPLTSGADATTINGEAHQAFLDKIEPYAYNALCCPSSDPTTVRLYQQFCSRVRDEVGSKFQLVAWQPTTADYEGIIGVWNSVTHSTISDVPTHSLVYWVAGAQAGCAVNKSLTNFKYDGELTINTDYTQAELEAAIKAGKFISTMSTGTPECWRTSTPCSPCLTPRERFSRATRPSGCVTRLPMMWRSCSAKSIWAPCPMMPLAAPLCGVTSPSSSSSSMTSVLWRTLTRRL